MSDHAGVPGIRRVTRSLLIRLLCVAVWVVGVAVVAFSSPESSAAPEAPLPPSVAAERVALELAAETGESVQVYDATDEFRTVVAHPDGTLSLRLHVGQRRMRDQFGGWQDVDFTMLSHADGTVAPRAHPRHLVLAGASGPGLHDLASMTIAGHELAVGWNGVLPDPELEHGKATYRQILPGVDLVIEVRRTGFQTYFIAESPAAAASVATVRMPWRPRR